MSYTDKELIRAAQLAYYQINSEVMQEVIRNYQSSSFTLSELYQYSEIFKRSVYEDIRNLTNHDYSEVKNLNREQILSYAKDAKGRQKISERLDIIDDIVNGEIGKWKVVSYVDNNDIGEKGMAGKLVDGKWDHQKFSKSGDGTAAVVFETGDGQAITAFRGSEDYTKINNIITDWLASDGGLALSNRDTPQQKSVYKYMEDYVLGLDYDDITLTGHSLGGNLAMHAAVSANEISSDMFRKITGSVSFDGPGFSDEYMNY